MVHAIHAAQAHGHPLRLDRHRILAGAGAIAFNAGLLMLLLVPITAPQLLPKPIRPPDITIFDPIEHKPVPPVPVLPDKPKPRPRETMRPAQPVQPVRPTVVPAVEPMEFDIPVGPVAEPPPQAGRGEDLQQPPATGTALSYARAPAPPYPRAALINGIEGTVLLEVLVDVDGRPLEVDIVRSSGNRDLDRAARRQVLRQWLFEPAIRNGKPVQARGLVPIGFSLD